MVAIVGGGAISVPGAPFAGFSTGRYLWPQWGAFGSAMTITTTSTRLYYYPIYIPKAQTFASASVYNSGAGDNGETLRIGIYSNNNGLPGTLLSAYTEITLTGAAAERNVAVSLSLSAGWNWCAIHHNSAAAMYGINASYQLSAAGMLPNLATQAIKDFGTLAFAPTFDYNLGSQGAYAGFYVDTAYGALASTAVAPTNTSLLAAPLMVLKV